MRLGDSSQAYSLLPMCGWCAAPAGPGQGGPGSAQGGPTVLCTRDRDSAPHLLMGPTPKATPGSLAGDLGWAREVRLVNEEDDSVFICQVLAGAGHCV